ncbi:MAG: TrmB family transcriptional regulator [Patescibacteria group bacterium]
MEENKIYFSLREIGLSDKEIALYLAALNSGRSGMSALARQAGLKRTSAYVVFNSLKEKGLLDSLDTKSGAKFIAKDPQYLLDKLKKESGAIAAILPELMALNNKKKNRPRITYYEGIDDYKRIMEECLHTPNITLRHIGSLSEGHRSLGRSYDLKYFMPTRIKNNIFLKAIYSDNVKPLFINSEQQLRDIRYLPKSLNLKTLTLIYGSRVVISTSRENLLTIVIDSEEIANDEIAKFDLMWSALKAE